MENKDIVRLLIEKQMEDKDSIKITKTTKGYNFEIKKYGADLGNCLESIRQAREQIVKDIKRWTEEEIEELSG